MKKDALLPNPALLEMNLHADCVALPLPLINDSFGVAISTNIVTNL